VALGSDFPKYSRRQEPAQLPRSRRRQRRHVDPADRALLELQRPSESDQSGRQLAHPRFVPDDRDPMMSMLRGQLVDNRAMRATRRKGGRIDDRRGVPKRRRECLCRLAGAHEWAGQHHVERHIELEDRFAFLLELLNPLARERPLRIVRILLASLRCQAMADQVELKLFGRHHYLARTRARAAGRATATTLA